MRPRIVLADGCFDLLHYGHLLHLQAAKRMGDLLVVAVTKDEAVNKGAGRPVFKQHQRVAMLRALRCVDTTMIVSNSLEALKCLVPDVFVKGNEYEDKISKDERNFCDANSIKIIFTDELAFSSTELLSHESRRN